MDNQNNDQSNLSKEKGVGYIVTRVLTPIATLITTVLVAYSNFFVEPELKARGLELQERLGGIESQIKVRDQDLKEKLAQREYDWKIYEEVVAAIKSHDEKIQEATQAIVIVMVENQKLRDSLLKLFATGGTEQVQQQAREIIQAEKNYMTVERQIEGRNLVNREKITDPHDWGQWDFHVLWCEASGDDAQKQATELVEAIKAETKTKGFVYPKKVPVSVSSSKSFEGNGYVIFKDEHEAKEAGILQGIANKALEKYGIEFSILPNTGKSSPWYLSAFICP